MSRFEHARLVSLLAYGLFFTMPFWLIDGLARLGQLAGVAGFAGWMGVWIMAVRHFRCASCGTSLFLSRPGGIKLYFPWPRRRCSACARRHDLTAG